MIYIFNFTTYILATKLSFLNPVPNSFLVNAKFTTWLCAVGEVILCYQWNFCFREVTTE